MRPSVVVTVLCAISLAACSGGGTKKAESTSTSSSTTSSTVASTATTEAGVADGRVPVYIKSLDTSGHKMTYDQIQFLTGAAAVKAFHEDHPDAQEDGVPNDYYIRNVNPKLYTVPLASDVSVQLNILAPDNQSSENRPVTLGDLAKALADNPIARTQPFWVTIVAGNITSIEEQYVP